MKIVIVGAGGHGQVVASMITAGASADGQPLHLAGFVDDDPSLQGAMVAGAPVLTGLSCLDRVAADAFVVAIGTNSTRARICDRLRKAGRHVVSVVHPHASVAADVTLGDGTTVSAGAVVVVSADIGRGVILNTGCTVDHHTRIGDFAHIAPGVHIGGDASIGSRALVGIGAVVLPRVRVGRGATVGAGAVVLADVPDGETVVGVPARAIGTARRRRRTELLVN
jgi:sugar O-acyltransferase (sialic acid O-acetyltransferase NeuD family)